MPFNQTTSWAMKHPQKLFLLDGLGALFSAVMLGIVFVELEMYIGIPKATCHLLAFIPCLFVVYDFFCYHFVRSIGPFLQIIGIMNIAYVLLSVSLAMLHIESITFMGFGYLFLEIVMVLFLTVVELKVAKR